MQLNAWLCSSGPHLVVNYFIEMTHAPTYIRGTRTLEMCLLNRASAGKLRTTVSLPRDKPLEAEDGEGSR